LRCTLGLDGSAYAGWPAGEGKEGHRRELEIPGADGDMICMQCKPIANAIDDAPTD